MILDIKDVSWPGWETVRLLGRGSYGGVYEIKRTVLNNEETAALKVISIPQSETEIDELISEGLDNDSISRTFENQLHYIVNEYAMMRKLTGCSNIVHSDDVKYVAKQGGIGWDIFIKMELLTPLTKALPAEISDETVIRIGKDMCNALAHCDHYNIVHRDIKPQNMFLTDTGVCKLGDFGIAKTMERTMGGTRIGTFKYMAPEVYHGKPYGSRSDIYSLGLVLYWLLNQRRMPFVPLPPAQLLGGMDGDAANRRISGEPFPAPVSGSEELKQIVMKACAFDPNDRFQSAEEMGKALDNIGRHPIVPPVPTPPPAPTDKTVRVAPAAQPVQTSVPFPAAPATQKKSGKGWLVAIIVLLLAAVIGLTAFILAKNSDDGDDDSDEDEISETQTPDDTDFGQDPTLENDPATPTVTEPLVVPDPTNPQATEPDVTEPDITEPQETQPESVLEFQTLPTDRRIDASGYIAALTSNGKVMVSSNMYGSNNGWKNIVSVAVGFDHTVALCSDGTVKTYGNSGKPYCTEPAQWTNIVAIDAASQYTVGLKKDGTVLTAGENTMGRGNVGNWTDIVAIAASDIATVGLKKDGTIVVATDYNFGNTSFWTSIVAVDVSNSHIVGLQDDGTVIASSLFNTNGECNVGDWKDIVAISAGSGHTVGLTKDGTVVAAGKDGNAALDVSHWKDVTAIAAGNSFTVGILKDGSLVYAGASNLFTQDAQSWTNLATE